MNPNDVAGEPGRSDIRGVVSHSVPFVAWLLVMALPWPRAEWRYALQALAGVAACLACRPWRDYPPIDWRMAPFAVFAGLGVLVIWIWPEAYLRDTAEGLAGFYLRFGVRPWGVLPKPGGAGEWETVGPVLLCIRLAGSGFVIASIEEFFWRGLVLRALAARDYRQAMLSPIPWLALAISALFFGFEHGRWAAGIVTGLVYGLVYLRTRDIWAAVIAHVTTNLGLGIYILATGNYAFWR